MCKRIYLFLIGGIALFSAFSGIAQPVAMANPDAVKLACLQEQLDKNDALSLDTLSVILSNLSREKGSETGSQGSKNQKDLDSLLFRLKLLDTSTQKTCLNDLVQHAFHGSYRNHLEALELLITEMKQLQSRNTAIQFVNYKNAYYNLLRSKSQLTAEVSQYFNLMETRITNNRLINALRDSIIIVDGIVDGVKGTAENSQLIIQKVDTSTYKIDKNLSTAYSPYFPVSQKALSKTKADKSDRIRSVGDLMLYDARRNNWWRAILGGAAGGILAGVAIGLFK